MVVYGLNVILQWGPLRRHLVDICSPATFTVTVTHCLSPPFSTPTTLPSTCPSRWWCGSGAACEWDELLHGECVLCHGHSVTLEQRPRTHSAPPPPHPCCLPGTRPGPPASHPTPTPFLPLQGEAAALSANAHPGRQVQSTSPLHWFHCLMLSMKTTKGLCLQEWKYVLNTALPVEEPVLLLFLVSVCFSWFVCIRRVRYSFYCFKEAASSCVYTVSHWASGSSFLSLQLKCYFIITSKCQIIIAKIHLKKVKCSFKFDSLAISVCLAYWVYWC